MQVSKQYINLLISTYSQLRYCQNINANFEKRLVHTITTALLTDFSRPLITCQPDLLIAKLSDHCVKGESVLF